MNYNTDSISFHENNFHNVRLYLMLLYLAMSRKSGTYVVISSKIFILNKVNAIDINDILKLVRYFYDNSFMRYSLHNLTIDAQRDHFLFGIFKVFISQNT